MQSPSILSRNAMGEPDPLLRSGSYIDPAPAGRHDDDTQPEWSKEGPGVEFVPGVVIDAKPISICRPEDGTMGGVGVQTSRRRNAEEMAKRPSWLPEKWTIELKTRNSGATAGQIDVYYVEPSGLIKCRSKNEVLHFLETGSNKRNLKRKSVPVAETKPSGTPATASRKQRRKVK